MIAHPDERDYLRRLWSRGYIRDTNERMIITMGYTFALMRDKAANKYKDAALARMAKQHIGITLHNHLENPKDLSRLYPFGKKKLTTGECPDEDGNTHMIHQDSDR